MMWQRRDYRNEVVLMFLNELSNEEKENFIFLAVEAANANGELADEEYLMLQEYCREMGIVYLNVDETHKLDNIISVFSISSKRIKKIVVFELLGLLAADGAFDEKERTFLTKFSNGIGITSNEVNVLQKLLKEYLSMSTKISNELSA